MSSALSDLPTEEVGICANCKQSETARDKHFEAWLCLKTPYQVQKCKRCEMRWLSPRPTRIGYETVYNAENYFSAQAGVNIAYENMLETRIMHFSNRLNSLGKYFPNKQKLHILDYGAATGEFVLNAIKNGHACSGIEFSEEARKQALSKHGITLYASEHYDDSTEKFDVIHMNHVFEHLPNLTAHLSWCKQHLVDDGLLVIEVPQQFNNHIDRLKRMLGRGGKFNSFNAFSLHHTYFFTAKNLSGLLENNGFKIESLTTDVAGPRLGGKKTLRVYLLRLISWLSNLVFNGGDNIEIFARLKN